LEDLNWKRFRRLIGPANAELARYDGILLAMINPSVLLSPLTTQEAVLSSRIEGTRATLQEVLEFECSKGRKLEDNQDIHEIINYRQAMGDAVQSLHERPICLNLLRDIHSKLMDSVRGQNRARGEFRRIQNFIGRPGATIENATYIPPDPSHVMDHLSNLEKYIHYDEDDKLVQLAVIHAQFEIIHPFLDGNGRVGRILIPLFLFEKKLVSSPMFYMSAYLENHRDEYYARLLAITKENDWEGWIEYFLQAIVEQAKINTEKARAILDLYEQKKEKIAKLTASKYSIQVVDALFDRPIFQTSDFIERSKIPARTAKRLLRILLDGQILYLLQEKSGSISATWMFRKLFAIAEGLSDQINE